MLCQRMHCALSKSPYSMFCFFPNLNVFIFWLCWVFVAAHRLSLVAASGGDSLWWTGFRGFSRCGARGLSLSLLACGLQQLQLMGSRTQAQ